MLSWNFLWSMYTGKNLALAYRRDGWKADQKWKSIVRDAHAYKLDAHIRDFSCVTFCEVAWQNWTAMNSPVVRLRIFRHGCFCTSGERNKPSNWHAIRTSLISAKTSRRRNIFWDLPAIIKLASDSSRTLRFAT